MYFSCRPQSLTLRPLGFWVDSDKDLYKTADVNDCDRLHWFIFNFHFLFGHNVCLLKYTPASIISHSTTSICHNGNSLEPWALLMDLRSLPNVFQNSEFVRTIAMTNRCTTLDSCLVTWFKQLLLCVSSKIPVWVLAERRRLVVFYEPIVQRHLPAVRVWHRSSAMVAHAGLMVMARRARRCGW